MEQWNGMNFPYRIRKDKNEYILEKYMLDNLFEDINLDETPIIIIATFKCNNPYKYINQIIW